MSDLMAFSSLGVAWQTRATQIAQLLRTVPAAADASILIMLGESAAQTALVLASATCRRDAVVLADHASQTVVEQVIQHSQAGVVVCHPAVFGWVSKLAFLNGCAAIYTCGNDQEGTLLDRAAHFDGGAVELAASGMARLQFYDQQGRLLK